MRSILLFILVLVSPTLHAQYYPNLAFGIYHYLAGSFKYPADAIACHAEGTVRVTFNINEDGSIADCKIAESHINATPPYGYAINEDGTKTGNKLTPDVILHCNNEALRVICAMPRWQTDTVAGRAEKSSHTLPINFELPKDGQPYKYHIANDIFSFVERMPEPAYDFNKYLKDNFKYPEMAKNKKVEGTVRVRFVVDEDGSITNCKVGKGIGSGCDEEALRLIQNMPSWKPGSQNILPVRVNMSMPVTFKL